MEKVKRRCIEYLAVNQLKQNLKGPILCFVGPPGVGKTSIGKSIAHTLGREFHRFGFVAFYLLRIFRNVQLRHLNLLASAVCGLCFIRIAVGGVSDQSDIRGHRRTYIGSMPGRIVNGLKLVGVKNPVFLLDEVDKLVKL